jgi:hypothetical protein
MKDRQPKHRQAARERARLDRQVASRAGLPTALIVCEGRCTEPHYLRGIIEHLGVNAANAHIQTGSYKTDALSLVRDARARFRNNPEYDHVFVVLDGDQAHLDKARREAGKGMTKAGGGRVTVDLIVTSPCFEYWLLLHFEYTTRSLRSADAVRALEAHLTDYEKGDREIFAKVSGGLAAAEANAARGRRDIAATGATSPRTDMPVLVAALRAMSRRTPE